LPTAIIEGYKVGGTSTMNAEHARIIQRGERRMPRKNEVCDMSCQFSFACANYNDNGTCVGFLLLSNGKLERHIKQNIDEYDRKSIERYIDMIQQTNVPTIRRELASVVYRYLEPEKQKPQRCTMIGLQRYIIHDNPDGSMSLTTPEPEPKPEIPNGEPEWKLRMLSRNQNRIKKEEEKK